VDTCEELGGLVSEASLERNHLIIASRESRLAMWQAEHVQALLSASAAGPRVDILGMTTEGDRVLDKALNEIGGKGLFIKELEVALLEGRADLAVHSLKDVPMDMPEDFLLAAVMKREDPRDAFVSNHFESLETLPKGARLGTSSLRRAAQIKAIFPHLQVLPLRGNVNTRLSKLDEGLYDAIVLAAAGLKRLGFVARIRQIIPPSLCLPAAGQGALGIEILKNDRRQIAAKIAFLNDPQTLLEVSAERAVSRALGGSCRVPLAAYCESAYASESTNVASPFTGVPSGRLLLRAVVAAVDGSRVLLAQAEQEIRTVAEAEQLGFAVSESLKEQGAIKLLGI
jgi:hydroxymethylbilane synthase